MENLTDETYRVKIIKVEDGIAYGVFNNGDGKETRVVVSFRGLEKELMAHLFKKDQQFNMIVSNNGRTSTFVKIP